MEIATYFLDGTCYSKTYDNPENESLCETIQSYMYEKCVPPTVEVHFQVNPIHFCSWMFTSRSVVASLIALAHSLTHSLDSD